MIEYDLQVLRELIQKYGPMLVFEECTVLSQGKIGETDLENLLDFIESNIDSSKKRRSGK